MKRRIARLLIATCGVIVIFLIGGTIFKKIKAEEAVARIRSLPDMVFTDINGNIFRTDQISTGPLLITYFHPECDHCRYEISSILSCDLLNSNLTILLVSHADLSQIETFMEQFDKRDSPSLHVLHDQYLIFREVFGTDIIPSSFIYNSDLQLVKSFKGEVTTETILKYLQSSD